MGHRIRIAAISLGLGLAGQAVAQDCNGNGMDDALDVVASFQGLGDLPGGEFDSAAFAISADARVVVGSVDSAVGYEPFRWTSDGGMVGLGHMPGYDQCHAWDVSADGSVVVGNCFGTPFAEEAFRWTAGAGMEALGHLPGRQYAIALAVSADGGTVVGRDCSLEYYWYSSEWVCEAFRWTSPEGVGGLGRLPSGSVDSSASGVSADGSVVVGRNSTSDFCGFCVGSDPCGSAKPFRWLADGGMMGVGNQACHYAHAVDVSPDGSIVIGYRQPEMVSPPVVESFRWSEEDGTIVLGDLPGSTHSVPLDLTPDGAVIVGYGRSTMDVAFLWDAVNGTRSLQAVLTGEYGVDLAGWTLETAEGISADGRSVVGYGTNPDGFYEGWIATLPFSADCDANGVPDECDQDCNANTVPDACEAWRTVPMDIRPGGCPNVLSRAGRGELPVVLLGTEEFDVHEVNLASVRLNRAGCIGEGAAPDMGPHGVSVAVEDIGSPQDGTSCSGAGHDGEADLLLKFRIDELVARLGLQDDPSGAIVELVVTGELNDGTPFIGTDRAQLVPPVPVLSHSKTASNRLHERLP